MKTLLSTTALAFVLVMPSLALAQTAQTTTSTESRAMGSEGFLSVRGGADLHASELMGHDVYVRRTPQDPAQTAGQTGDTRDHQMMMMNRSELDQMDNIGQINDIILSHDGQVRAVVIGIGGFLGIGEQDVAITMDQVTFASDQDDRDQMYVVVNTNLEMLADSPAYDRTRIENDRTTAAADRDMDAETRSDTDRTRLNRPEVVREGYQPVEISEISSEMLVGQTVYGVNDDSVGTIDELILDDSGSITNVIIDFGGFLGFATRQVSLSFDELTIMSDARDTNVRVYVDATKEQIEALPQYEARR